MAEDESLKAEMSALLRGDLERARERREHPAEPEPPAQEPEEPEPEPEQRPGRFRRLFG